jgi:site-specific DNA recombinase
MAKTSKFRDDIDRTVRKTALRAAIYARVSTDQQEEEGTSLDTQVDKAILYCEARKYIVDPRYIYQETFTGMLYRERKILCMLREAMREGEFDVLVVYALDRFSRVQAHQVILLEELEHHNVKFESVTEEIDNSIEGQIIRSIMGIVAQVEHEKILERTERGRLSRAEDEKSMLGAGIATYGYIWNEKRTGYLIRDDLLRPDANGIQWTEEQIVSRMFDQYARGATIRAIASTLTNEKVPTRKGGEIWRPSTVSQILSNPIYTGKATAFKWEVLERTNKDGH